jgi:predicted dehydrogenase
MGRGAGARMVEPCGCRQLAPARRVKAFIRACDPLMRLALSVPPMPRSERRTLGVALLGCGAAARQYHLRALRADPRVRLLAVADPSPAALAAARLPGGTRATRDPGGAMAAPGVEAAVIAASTPAHEALARAAIEGGLHAYVEKPVALDTAAAESLAALARGSGRICAAGFNYRTNPAFARLRERVRDGEIGRVRAVRASFCEPGSADPPPWRRDPASGGGVLMDLGSHEVDTLRWLLGSEVASIARCATGSTLTELDEAELELRMADGTTVTSRLSYRAGREHRWLVEGDRGRLRLDRWPPRVSARRRGVVSGLERRLRDSPLPRREPSFRTALAAFVGAALGGREELPTLEDGARSLAVVLALTEAAKKSG